MPNEKIILTDYSPVKEEYRKSCMDLQEKIDEGKFEILIPEELKKRKEDREGKYPTVFGLFNNEYYTKKYAGILYYDGKLIIIHSRFDGESDKNYFLRYALEKTDLVPWKILADMDVSMSPGSMFRALLGQIFLRQLQEAYAVGVYREYRSFEYNDARPKGRLDIARHIRLNPMENGKVAYSTREYTTDNPMNHLILAAYGCLLARSETKKTTQKFLEKNKSLRRPLEELGWSLGSEEITAANLKRILHQTERAIAHPLHRKYENVRRTARMILKNYGLELFENAGKKVGGVLIPMDRLWELFLEKAVFPCVTDVSTSAQEKIPVILEKGKENAKGKRIFKPDFILKKVEEKDGQKVEVKTVLDAKYRKAWSDAYTKDDWRESVRNDVFQVMSYMFVTKAKIGGILFPQRRAGAEDKGENKEYKICAGMSEEFRIIPVPIADTEKTDQYEVFCRSMDEYCNECAETIKNCVQTP